jgi:hypothetical protein
LQTLASCLRGEGLRKTSSLPGSTLSLASLSLLPEPHAATASRERLPLHIYRHHLGPAVYGHFWLSAELHYYLWKNQLRRLWASMNSPYKQCQTVPAAVFPSYSSHIGMAGLCRTNSTGDLRPLPGWALNHSDMAFYAANRRYCARTGKPAAMVDSHLPDQVSGQATRPPAFYAVPRLSNGSLFHRIKFSKNDVSAELADLPLPPCHLRFTWLNSTDDFFFGTVRAALQDHCLTVPATP